jgi:hypothetical protein
MCSFMHSLFWSLASPLSAVGRSRTLCLCGRGPENARDLKQATKPEPNADNRDPWAHISVTLGPILKEYCSAPLSSLLKILKKLSRWTCVSF